MLAQVKHQSIFDRQKYIEYQPGTLNLIISVPHGGILKPAAIQNRDAGAVINGTFVYDHKYEDKKDFAQCGVRYKQDKYTMEIAKMVAEELCKLTGHRPHVVISHLYRGKMDPNCDLEKGAFGVPQAVEAWQAYQQFVGCAKEAIKGSGLFLEIHGQIHSEQWVELGYTLPGKTLNSKLYTAQQTSIRNLAEKLINENFTMQDLIYGPHSLGGLLSAEGYTVVPSPQNPGPFGKKYFTGGYNTEEHGSKTGGVIDAIQVECPQYVRNEAAGGDYSAALARAVHRYLQLYYSLPSPSS